MNKKDFPVDFNAEKIYEGVTISCRSIFMHASQTTFEFDGQGSGNNTRLDYHFSSQGTTVRESVIVEGVFTADDVETLSRACDGRAFDPPKIGLPDLFSRMPISWEDNGFEMHSLDRISTTSVDADDSLPSADQIVAMAEYGNLPTSWSTEPDRAIR